MSSWGRTAEGEEGEPSWREPRPRSVTGSAGATFPRREGEFLCPPGGGFAPLPRSETKWGRPGGGGSQQQHPEQSVGEIRRLHHGPVGHALNQRLIVEYRLVQGHLQATILEEGKLSALLLLVGTTHPCSLRSLSPPTALRRLRSAGGAPPSLPGKESSYVLLGEDRLGEARARRGRLNWWEPRPPSVKRA